MLLYRKDYIVVVSESTPSLHSTPYACPSIHKPTQVTTNSSLELHLVPNSAHITPTLKLTLGTHRLQLVHLKNLIAPRPFLFRPDPLLFLVMMGFLLGDCR